MRDEFFTERNGRELCVTVDVVRVRTTTGPPAALPEQVVRFFDNLAGEA